MGKGGRQQKEKENGVGGGGSVRDIGKKKEGDEEKGDRKSERREKRWYEDAEQLKKGRQGKMNKRKSEVRYELKCGKEGEVGACRVLEKKRKGCKRIRI